LPVLALSALLALHVVMDVECLGGLGGSGAPRHP
jgi:hypothetical protein